MEGRRRITLYDQMAAAETSSRSSLASLIFGDVVLANQNSEAGGEAETTMNRNRILSDIIREDEPNNIKDRRSWKALKDKLWLKRASGSGSAWTSTTLHIPIHNDDSHRASSQSSRRNSVSFQTYLNSDESTQHDIAHQQHNDIVEEDADNPRRSSSRHGPPEAVAAKSSGEAAAAGGLVSMSLMEVLEETEVDFEVPVSDNDEDDEQGGEEEEEGGGEEEGEVVEETGVVAYNCCVCMVRHKGAAFIPCGHTFCRMCSRELWLNRGNCPLCNHFILEILDIF